MLNTGMFVEVAGDVAEIRSMLPISEGVADGPDGAVE